MTDDDFHQGVAAVLEIYGGSRLLPPKGDERPLRIAPVPIPNEFWGGGETRLLVVFNLVTHETARPRGLLGMEWALPGGGVPFNANAVFEFGENWQGYSWNFPWPPALGVTDTVEAYLGRFGDHRDLRIPRDLYDRLLGDVRGDVEWAGYLLCGTLRTDRDTLLAREWHPVPQAQRLKISGHGFSWHPDFDIDMLNRMQREDLCAVILHFHGGDGPGLSRDDRTTAESLMPFLSQQIPDRSHAFLVLGERAIGGPVYQDGHVVAQIGDVRIAGASIDDWTDFGGANDTPGERYDRLVRGFGDAAFRRLRRAHVGVIGAGGGASHVIQQLAYLGCGTLTVVDADRVETTNLNRLIGAVTSRPPSLIDRLLRRSTSDVGTLKVEVMARMVRAIDDSIDFVAIAETFPTVRTVELMRRCDVVIACVDKLQPRDDLNRLSKRYLIPMIDVGIEITPSRTRQGSVEAISGRITKVLPDGPCLRCQGIVDDEKLAAERDGQPLGYTGAAQVPDPAVVTLNGIVASIAATELLQLLTGFAGRLSPNCGWIYDGITGQVQRVVKTTTDCEACRYERALGDPQS